MAEVEQAVEAFGSSYQGMSLRDWFAGLASPLATWAYAAADAMIQEREKK